MYSYYSLSNFRTDEDILHHSPDKKAKKLHPKIW